MTSPRLSLLNALIEGRTGIPEEMEIIEVFRTADATELNALLTGVDTDALFASVDDHVLQPHHRTQLLQLLAVERRPELTVDGRAAVIYGLQAGRTTSAMELAIADLFLDVRGDDLTRLKNQINMRRDIHDLEGLVFVDIDDDGVRQRILDHIAVQARSVAPHEAKVLSDIDDTVFAKLHDKRYPSGTLYPGLVELFEALDDGPDEQPYSTGDLTFLTARPMDAFGLIESGTHRALKEAGIGTSSVLSGGFRALASKDLMAGKKLANVDHYRLLFPEYDLVFIGDSGQGDVRVGEGMYERHPEAIKAVFIHDVVDTPEAERAAYAEKKIYFVDTYVGAATKALELDLISRSGLDDVIADTRTRLDALVWDSPEQERRMRALVERDLAAVPSGLG